MNTASHLGRSVQHFRAQIRELGKAAERARDPELRRRLQDKARRLQERCEQEADTAVPSAG
ncbi:DUF6381 family protein [Streptomyces sp. ASQP_92]|uniref:DUF6381 family protein n=1 Tax=unclassified Streptomyces TaxID=2593676 RepID=UPI0021C17D93|nr:DUF6381 family protein [Streptomyces sp. ASQP_92]MCT9092456.1 DUF6381 family protein [Streptomyces sp. ASQP_92]